MTIHKRLIMLYGRAVLKEQNVVLMENGDVWSFGNDGGSTGIFGSRFVANE